MKKLILIALVFLCGCAPDLAAKAKKERSIFEKVSQVRSPNERLKVVDGPFEFGAFGESFRTSEAWILQDTKTGQEFLFVRGSDSMTVSPLASSP